jgi:hypothetical protein
LEEPPVAPAPQQSKSEANSSTVPCCLASDLLSESNISKRHAKLILTFLPRLKFRISSASQEGSSSTKEGWDITKEAIELNRPLKPYERTKEEMVLQKITSSKNFTNLFRENTRNEKKPLEAKLKR